MSRLEGGNQTSGFCVWFTGLSGSGKTTTAALLWDRLRAEGRDVSLLDGDVVRRWKNIGFSRDDRDRNVLRVGHDASQIVYGGGIAVCALISPYRVTRDRVRTKFAKGQFLEVHIATPLAVCEERDTKGLYQKARAGELHNLTGVHESNPYEPPLAPEVILETTKHTVEQNVDAILAELALRELVPSMTKYQ